MLEPDNTPNRKGENQEPNSEDYTAGGDERLVWLAPDHEDSRGQAWRPEPRRKTGSAFSKLPDPAEDQIFAMMARFEERLIKDPHAVNLGVGIYRNDRGVTPLPEAVKEAARRVLEKQCTGEINGGYLPIEGLRAFNEGVVNLVLGEDNPLISAGKIKAVQTPGGTAAVRLAVEFLGRAGVSSVHVSDPTWGNHHKVIGEAGLKSERYPYLDIKTGELDFDRMNAHIQSLPEGSAVLMHACCHNPSGVDPSPEQWLELADTFNKRGHIAFFDMAYQGFGNGFEEDALAPRVFAEAGVDTLVAYSFSKNAGLYDQRTGALIVVSQDPALSEGNVLGNLKEIARTTWSNPPAFGARVMAEIFADNSLRAGWIEEVNGYRAGIQERRELMVEKFNEKGLPLYGIDKQKGMFALYVGIRPGQVERLEDESAVFMLPNGRINVAAITPGNVCYVADSIAAAIKEVP
ncbi:MAG: aspartate/tyrosine/aromatic aminotransferase [Candidatus Dadabacteria bacterium]|nr:MAG: aspartate/tyrosine/aromatic aminotransferase [Candidatus Dadabacteria bacterium]